MDRNTLKYVTESEITGINSYQNRLKAINHNIEKFLCFTNLTENAYRRLIFFIWFLIDMMIIRHEFFYRLYPSELKTSVEKEIFSANISKNDRVLHIGCGPYPITAIFIEKIIGAYVVGIDNKPIAVELAKKYIQSKKIKNIEIEYASGEDYSASNFDSIIITSTTYPRKEILENIIRTAKEDCIIICRELSNTDSLIKSIINSSTDLYIIKKINHSLNWSSYLIKKK